LNFWTSLFHYDLISKQLFTSLIEKKIEIWLKQPYGLGVYISSFGKYDSYFILGNDAGVDFTSMYVPKIRLNVNVFSNKSQGHDGIYELIINECNEIIN